MERNVQNQQAQGWHTAQWGTWGWIETILKLIALVAGIVAFFGSTSAEAFVLADHPHLAAVILLALLTLGSLAQLGIRYTQRETISLVFALVNLLGHLGLLIALLRLPNDLTLPLIFGVFYALGQASKLQFLRATGYTEGGADTRGMLLVAAGMTAFYLLFVILVLL